MAEYRAGHFAEAIEWLGRGITLHLPYGPGQREPIALFFIAMAESKLGHAREAEAAFAKAAAIVQRDGPSPPQLGKYFGAWIMVLQARKEAAEFLGHPLDPPTTQASDAKAGAAPSDR
jgi:hypothetical protein